MRTVSTLVAAAAALSLVAGPAAADRSSAPAPGVTPPTWAPVESATVRPGARLGLPVGGTCTANFVFTDVEAGDDGVHDVYLGTAAHCFPAERAGGGVSEETFCTNAYSPLGTAVPVEGAVERGALAYHSGLAMQVLGETDASACFRNDFALVRLHPDDAARVNPTVPVFGGPTGVDTDWAATGEPLQVYGRSETRGSTAALYPLRGVITDPFVPDWDHTGYVAPTAYYGDSGSAALTTDGRALGVLTGINVFPTPGAVSVLDLATALSYARTHGGPQVELALGTEPHVPDLPEVP